VGNYIEIVNYCRNQCDCEVELGNSRV